MMLGLKTVTEISAALLLLALLAYTSQGLETLYGVARLSGPLEGCLVLVSGNNATAANCTTDGRGSLNVTIGPRPEQVIQVFVNSGTSCMDVFSNLPLPFQLSSALPPDAKEGNVGYGSFMGMSYMEQVLATAASSSMNSINNTNVDNSSSSVLSDITAVRQVMRDLYDTLNISVAAFQLDPLQLQPLALVQSANATTRSFAVALLAADAEMGALVALGAALLNAVASNGSDISAAAVTAATNMTLLARAVAAEGARQLMELEAQRQTLLAAAAAATAAAGNKTADVGPPSSLPPPSPPPLQSPASVGGLYTTEVVVAILEAAATRAGVTVPSYAVNATAAVIAGMAAYAEVVKDAALLEVGGVKLGLNPLNALITMTRLAVVQADAAAQMPQLLGNSPQALQTYALDALPERLSMATVNMSAIHDALGLPAPAAPVPGIGAAHVVGPLSGCTGQAAGVWDPSYEAFATSAAGSFALAAKGLGMVTVTPYRYCQDSLTELQLSLSVSNLGPAMGTVSVSPVAMLAQAFYTLQSSQGLQTLSIAQQTAAFAAVGLNLTTYNAVMMPSGVMSSRALWSPPPPLSAASLSPLTVTGFLLAESPSQSPPPCPPPSTLNNTAALGLNLSHPLIGSIIAANVQLVSLIYSARAMFATSCYYAYGLGSMENANTFTATLTLYSVAQQAVNASGMLKLSDAQQLEQIFNFVATACYFNSSAQFVNTSSQQPSSGTFLSGGSATAIGAITAGPFRSTTTTTTSTARGRRRSLRIDRGVLPAATTGADADADASKALAMAAAEAAGGLLSGPSLAVQGLATLRRRLRAELFTLHVTGPQLLLWQRAVEDLGAGRAGGWSRGTDWRGAIVGQGPGGFLGAGEEEGRASGPDFGSGGLDADGPSDGGAAGGGGGEGGGAGGEDAVAASGHHGLAAAPAAAAAAAGSRVLERGLGVYVDDPDIATVYHAVAVVLSGIIAKLQTVQALSNASAAAVTASSSASSSASSVSPASYNLTALVEMAAALGYVVQQSFYTELANAMAANYSSGIMLVSAVQGIALRYTGTALLQRMAEAPINRALICAAYNAQCSGMLSPSGGSGDGAGKKGNKALYAGVGVGAGLGIVATLLVAWALRRAARRREVKKAVVNNFKSGDMHHMALRLPSAAPLDNVKLGGAAAFGNLLDAYPSVVPAALGSDPTVAQDYPLYPMATFNPIVCTDYVNNAAVASATNAATAAAAAAAAAGKAALPGQPSGSGTPPRFPLQGDGTPSSASQLLLAQQLQHQQQQQHHHSMVPSLLTHSTGVLPQPAQRLAQSAGAGVVKTYANYGFVGAVDGGGSGGGGADAATLRDNLGDSARGGHSPLRISQSQVPHHTSSRSAEAPGGELVAANRAVGNGRSTDAAGVTNASEPGRPSWQNTPIGALRRPGLPPSSDGTADHVGGGGGGSSLLNASIGHRPGCLPPLASYTAVTNSAAPTAALNTSLRTIPVNTNFNSSLRPPPAAARP